MYSYHLPKQATSITPPNHYRYPRRLFYQGFFLCFQLDMMSWAGRRRRHRNTIIMDVKRA